MDIPKSTLFYRYLRCIIEFDYGYFCSLCLNRKEKMEFAHIKKTLVKGEGRGFSNRYNDLKMYPNSYILLCKECHNKLDTIGL